jgi:CDP-glucose 4,6-dehydratase
VESLEMSIRDLFGGFYIDKKILVTGHTGFKGCWLAFWLAEMGAKVAGYSLQPPSVPSLFETVRLQERLCGHYTGDVTDLKLLTKTIQREKPEIVFHLAAQTLVQHSYKDPLETFTTNVLGTANVLEAVRRVPKVVRVCQIITSDKCYQNPETGHRCLETDPLGGSDPYSASKTAAEIVVASYRKSFFPAEQIQKHGVSLSSVRAGNVIGAGDWAKDRLIPDSIRALNEKKAIPVRNPHAVRPWQYVLDALSGYLLLAMHQAGGDPKFADAWNFGPVGTATLTVAELVEKVISQWGEGRWITQENQKACGETAFAEARLLQLDSAKAQRQLAWKPVYSLDEMLKVTVEGYREMFYEKTGNPGKLAVRQVEAYVQAATQQECSWTKPDPKIKK